MTMTMTFGAKVRCKDLLDSYKGNFRCQHAIDSSSYSTLKFSQYTD